MSVLVFASSCNKDDDNGSNIPVLSTSAVSTSHWNSPNTDATNKTGFTALPGGHRFWEGTFRLIGNYGFWWSATEYDATTAWHLNLSYNYSGVYNHSIIKELGFSVRCVKD